MHAHLIPSPCLSFPRWQSPQSQEEGTAQQGRPEEEEEGKKGGQIDVTIEEEEGDILSMNEILSLIAGFE